MICWAHCRSLLHFPLLNNFKILIDQKRTENFIGFVQYFLQHFLQMLLFILKRYNSHHRPLPRLVMIQFRHRYIKLPPQFVFEAPQYLPFIL